MAWCDTYIHTYTPYEHLKTRENCLVNERIYTAFIVECERSLLNITMVFLYKTIFKQKGKEYPGGAQRETKYLWPLNFRG